MGVAVCACGCGATSSARYIRGHNTKLAVTATHQVDAATGCWEFTGYIQPNGYGRKFNRAKHKNDMAHRYYYEAANGPIPDGFDVHHTCENRSCVNPAHLVLMEHTTHLSHHGRKRYAA